MRKMLPVLLVLGFSLAAVPVRAAGEEPYLWPLRGIAVKLTGVMYDKRNDHAHAGIDLSLFGKTGVTPVVAVREGVLMRIRDSRYGYGRTVYIRHPDKHVTVYAHLDRFSPRLQQIADGLRRRTGLKRLDYYYEEDELNVPIARGEVLGYGGNTGTRTPHLHFELRWDDVVNLNPLTNGFAVRDTVPPSISRLLLVPVDPGATVNGKGEALLLDARRLPGEAEPVAVRGRVGLAVEADDGQQPHGARFSPYRLALLADGKPWFATRYERYSYLDRRAHLAQFDREPAGRALFHRLYNPYPAELPFFSAPDAGALGDLPPGVHALTVMVADAAGLETRVELAVRVETNPQAGVRPWPRGTGPYQLADGGSVAADEGRLLLEAPAGSCFEPFRFTVERVSSGVYRLSEPPLPLRNEVVFKFRYSDEVQDPEQLGVYRRDHDRLEFLGAEHDPAARTVAGSSLSFGRLEMLRDNRPPTLGEVRQEKRAPQFLSFTVQDDLSGLAPDAVRVYVDDELAVVDFDRRRGAARAELIPWPASGPHEVRIEISDRIGNRTIRRFSQRF